MGNWEKRIEEKKEIKEKEKVSSETLGKFFYDLAKTSFTAMVPEVPYLFSQIQATTCIGSFF
ncbi:hypothetical protein [Bacteroides sp.]|uniref:hypothetical protein n=1 Tax=Bacteroides sp. TaxID=29523 RepID=UPI00260857A3|nr:hypothetical protein [Bacteroides sp.]